MVKLTGKLKTSHEGLMIGNGTLGALIYGENKLTISLDRVDLWDFRNPPEYKNKEFDYQHLVKYLKEDYSKAFSIFDACYLHPYPTKINAEILNAEIDVSDADESEIDYLHGKVRYKSTNNFLTAYVDANKDVIVLKFNRHVSYNFSMAPYFTRSLKDRGLGYKEHTSFKDGKFNIICQEIYKKHQFNIVYIEKDNSIYITIVNGTNVKNAEDLLSDYIDNEVAYFAKHLKYYKSYFGKSNVRTPDKKINEQYNLGRYYFASNSRKKYPVTLHGVWTQNNSNLPPWKADYHNDINVEMSYESYLKNGNYKEGKVLLNYLTKLKPTFKKNAKNFMHSEGIYIPGVMSQKGLPLGGWPQYAMNPCCQIWLIKSFDEYFEYTKDENYLKSTVYPIFRDVEKCVFSVLKVNDEGNYELGYHSSPEFFEDNIKSIFATQTNFEITMLKYLYSKLVRYCEILNLDGTHYSDVLNHISDFLYDEEGCLKISKDRKFDMSHRHFSHMLMYKNMELLDPYINKQQAEKDINHLVSFGTDEWVGFSFVEAAGLYAYINKGEEAAKNLRIFATNFTHPNGFHMNNDYKEYKYSKMTCYVMTLEANFGFVRSLNDMMIQNFENKLTIFPAISEKFKNSGTSFRKLRIHGDHQVSAKIKKDSFSFKIKMKKEDKIKLFNNFKENPVITIDGKPIQFNSKIGQFIEITSSKEIAY